MSKSGVSKSGVAKSGVSKSGVSKSGVSKSGASRSEPLGVPLLVAAAATGAEALGLAASALGLSFYKLLGHRPFDSGDLWAVVGMAAAGAIGLGLVVRGLARVRRWARSPAVLTQLIVVPIGVTTILHGGELVGIPLAACGLVGLVALFAPSTTSQLNNSSD